MINELTFAFWAFLGRKSCTILMDMNVEIIQFLTFIYFLWNHSQCTSELKFGMMTYHYLFYSFGYSKMPYGHDHNCQVH